MFNLLRNLYENDVELRIDKAPALKNVMRFTLRSNAHCMVRYCHLDHPATPELGSIVADLYLFYKEFMEEKGRREELAKILVSMPEICEFRDSTTAIDSAYKEFVKERVSTATDGGV